MRDAIDVVPTISAQRRSDDPAVALAALAGEQHGVVARRQLTDLGFGRHAIGRLLERGRLHAIHRGVYAVGHRRITREGAWTAAVLAAGEHALLSHRAAGALWALRDASGRRVDVTVPGDRRTRDRIRIHRARVPLDERTMHRGIPVTTPARTLLDLAAVLDGGRLARAVERAEALRLGSPTSLAALLGRYPRRAGVPALRRILARGVGSTLTRSELEDRFLDLVDAARLPRPLVNAQGRQTDRTMELDFTWRADRLIVEVDGFETHGTRAAFERDRARDRALQVAGWRVVRVTSRQLDEAPEKIAAELETLLFDARRTTSRRSARETSGAPRTTAPT